MLKKRWTIILVIAFSFQLHAQSYEYPFYQLYQLDSIASSPGIPSHFGKLYGDFLRLIEKRLEDADTSTKRLLRHFEQVFAQFYIDAALEFRNNKPITHPSWRKYFSDTTLSNAQYYLLGANAHLNGQLSEAIFHSYTPAEWKTLKKHYYLFNKCLNETFRHVYRESLYAHKRARTLHALTLGLDKAAGNYILFKWRKRQMRVTEYRFNESRRHKKLFAKVERKKNAIDRLIFIQLLDRHEREAMKRKGV